jgi:hypothetical protein
MMPAPDNDTPWIRLTGALDVDSFEAAWTNGFQAASMSALAIDLSRVRFIHVEFLPYLLGVVAEVDRRHGSIQFRLPRRREVRDFIRAWRFPEAVRATLDRPFETLLDDTQKILYWDDAGDDNRYLRTVSGPSGRQSYLPKSFFALTPISLGSMSPARSATLATAPWLETHALEVLDAYFPNMAERIGTHVIRELVINAASHPNAKTAFTCSQFRFPKTPDHEPRHMHGSRTDFEIHVWDNGDSIIDTLKHAWNRDGGITSPAFGTDSALFEFIRSDLDPSAVLEHHVEVLRSDDATVMQASPEHLLLSAFFLGISSDPAGASKVHGAPTLRSGEGLYHVRRTIIDLLDGQITYASGRHRLVLSRHPNPVESDCHYLARVSIRSEADPWVLGNLIRITATSPKGLSLS